MMITLHGFGPGLGLPDASPFVMKTDVLLKMSGLPYRVDPSGLAKAPKGKVPYIEDDGEIVADSTLIRWHLERKYGIAFDAGLSPEQKATAWAFEKMAEDQLYWAILDARWMDDANFARGPAAFFKVVPAPLRPLVIPVIRRKIGKNLKAHGMGRHSPDEITALATRSIDSIAAFLGTKRYFFGDEPTGVDATMFSFVAGVLCPVFETPRRAAAERHDNLKRYVGRMTARYYPEAGEVAGCKAAA